MSNKFLMGFVGTSALLIGIASSSSAYAGFQWVAPEQSSSQSYQPPASSYQQPQSAMNAPEVISPVIISGSPAPAMPAAQPAMQYAPSAPSSYTPPAPQVQSYTAPAPQAQAYAPPMTASAAPTKLSMATATLPAPAGGDIVQGFASQVPLTIALRQVLPTGYNFSIDQNIDLGTTVSYRGGKSWRETVSDMLAPLGLTGREQGSTIVVSKAGASFSPPPLPPAPTNMASDTIPISSTPSISQSPPSMGTTPMLLSAHSEIPAMNVNSPDGWTAEHGDTLHKVLTQWCQRQGVELQWLAEYDYPVEASAHFMGSFEDAVRNLLAGFESARPQPIGELHSNPNAGQMVLVVSPRGNSYSN